MLPLRDNIRSKSFPAINILLILLNIIGFAMELLTTPGQLLEGFIFTWGIIPVRFLAYPETEWVTIFTSMFLHGGWSHIIGNMVYLWIFGDNVEDRLGHFRYLIFYLTVGCAAAITQIYLNPVSRIPMIGASGAIAGVLGAYFVLYPRAKVLALVPIWVFLRLVEVPAVFFLGFWFVMQYLQGLGSITQRSVYGDVGGVAWWAHAGGFIAGIVFVILFGKARKSRR